MGNPFVDFSPDLIVLDTRDIMDPLVSDTVRKLETLGEEQYQTFVNERLTGNTTLLTDPIKRNNLPLFSWPPPKSKSK